VGPSAAQIAAVRAQERARLRAERAKQLAKAKRLAAKAKAREEALERKRAGEQLRQEDEAETRRTPAAGFATDGESSSKKTAPLVGMAFLLALVVLTLGLVPAYLVPWYRMSMVLEEHHQQFTWVGGMAVLATGILFLMVVLGG
jgi:hypothetical protein